MTLGHLIENASTAKPSWRVVLHRCLDTALIAAAGIGALDWMASRSFCPRTAGLGQLFLVLLGLAPLMALTLFLAAQASLRIEVRGRWPRVALAALSGVLLALPLLLVVRLPLGLPSVTMLALATASAASGTLIGRRLSLPLAWLLAALVASLLVHDIFSVLALKMRINPSHPGTWLAIALASQIGGLALAPMVYALLRSCLGQALSWWLSAAMLAAAVGAWFVVHALVPPTYGSIMPVAHASIGLLAALGASGFRLGGRLSVRLLLVAAAALANVAVMTAEPTATIWRFSNCSSVGRGLDRKLNIIHFATLSDTAVLRRTPNFARGAAAIAEAVAWNQRPVPMPAPARPLSILLLTCESLRYDLLGYSGLDSATRTPVLDALASRGQRFHSAYANAGWTSLSAPSFLWGRYPKDITFVNLYEDDGHNLYFESEIPPAASIARVFYSPRNEEHPSLAQILGDAGLKTAAVPNDGNSYYFNPHLQFTRGFQRVFYPREYVEKAVGHPVGDVPDRYAVELATAVLRKYREERFFIWVHLFDSHLPHLGSAGETGMEGFKAEIRDTDAQVGRLLKELATLGRADDTVVVVMGDHGESFRYDATGIHGLDLHDDSMHVALLVDVPGVPPHDVKLEVGLIDVAPTLLALAGVAVPDSIQGRSLLPWIAEPALADHLPSPPVFMETRRSVLGEKQPSLHLVGAAAQNTKVVFDAMTGTYACYDLDQDAGELRPIPGGIIDVPACTSLAAYLQGWWSSH